MLTAKEAVKIAKDYMADMYGTSIESRIEEVTLDETESVWHLTMGFWEYPPIVPNTLSTLMQINKPRRAYKEIAIAAETGNVISMKIRVIPAAPEGLL
jgi:hypothetical protein